MLRGARTLAAAAGARTRCLAFAFVHRVQLLAELARLSVATAAEPRGIDVARLDVRGVDEAWGLVKVGTLVALAGGVAHFVPVALKRFAKLSRREGLPYFRFVHVAPRSVDLALRIDCVPRKLHRGQVILHNKWTCAHAQDA